MWTRFCDISPSGKFSKCWESLMSLVMVFDGHPCAHSETDLTIGKTWLIREVVQKIWFSRFFERVKSLTIASSNIKETTIPTDNYTAPSSWKFSTKNSGLPNDRRRPKTSRKLWSAAARVVFHLKIMLFCRKGHDMHWTINYESLSIST